MTTNEEGTSAEAPTRGFDFDSLNKWLLLLTNLGVLAGVFLLAVEIRQNHEIMQRDQDMRMLDAAHIDVARFTEWRKHLISDKEIAKLYTDAMSGQQLDDVDQVRFNLLCNDLIWAAALMHERSVVLERPDYERATVTWIRDGLANSKAFNDCWTQLRDVYLLWGYEGFVELVEQP